MINNQLILFEATKKELKITDAEVREEVEMRYGPNTIINLVNLGLTYDEALKMTKEDMIIQRMMYYFIKVKADQKITPSAIRSAYRLYCRENPPLETWSYYTISIKSDDDISSQKTAEEIHALLKEKSQDPKEIEDLFSDIKNNHKNCQISISNLFKVNSKEIATSQQKILSNLKINSYSDIICQTSRTTNKKIHRLFYLKDYEKKDTETFEEKSNKLKEELLNKALAEEFANYFTKLKKQYHVEKNPIISNDFVPFSLSNEPL
jgi:hypothetical protein